MLSSFQRLGKKHTHTLPYLFLSARRLLFIELIFTNSRSRALSVNAQKHHRTRFMYRANQNAIINPFRTRARKLVQTKRRSQHRSYENNKTPGCRGYNRGSVRGVPQGDVRRCAHHDGARAVPPCSRKCNPIFFFARVALQVATGGPPIAEIDRT